jgi:hypothetical protein
MRFRSQIGSTFTQRARNAIRVRRVFCHNAIRVGGARSSRCYRHPLNRADIYHTLRHRDSDHGTFTRIGGRPLHRSRASPTRCRALWSADAASPVLSSAVSPGRGPACRERSPAGLPRPPQALCAACRAIVAAHRLTSHPER